MGIIGTLTDFQPNTTAVSAQVDANFSAIRTAFNTYAVLTDIARTITATLTFTPSAGQAFSVTTGGITVAGGLNLTGSLTMATAASKIVPGATSLSLRNNADGADNLLILNDGTATFRSGATVTLTTLAATSIGGTLTTAAQTNITSLGTLTALSVGNITLSGTSVKVIGSATSTLFRNTGDSLTWLSYTESGTVVAIGSGMKVQLGTAAPATNATIGFPVMPVTSAAPTGIVPEGAFCVDDSGGVLTFHISLGSGTWKSVALS